MAISRMQKLSLILAKEDLDDLLRSLQELAQVEIRDMELDQVWQEAFDQGHVNRLNPIQGDSTKEGLTFLLKRQEALEVTLKEVRGFLPQKGFFQSLRQKRRQLGFEEVEDLGRESLEQELLQSVKALLTEHKSSIETLEILEAEKRALLPWKGLEKTPGDLANFQQLTALVGTIPNTADNASLNLLREQKEVAYQEVFHSEIEYGLIIFLPKELRDPQILEQISFKLWDYPHEELPARRLEILDEEKQALIERQEALRTELSLSQGTLEQLEAELETITNRHSRELAKTRLAQSESLVALEAWVEARSIPALKKTLLKEYGDRLVFSLAEVEEKDWEEAPVKLVNHGLIEPFELVTEMYALPKYYEKDPTPYLAPFYFTFFGMMVADLGYGLLMLLLTGLALWLFELPKATRRFLKFFNILGLAVSLWGLIYGSFFAFDLPVKLISTTDDVMTILILSVIFGFITVLTGLYLGGRQKLRVKEYGEAYTSGFAWCFILLGILGLVLGKMMPSLSYLAPLGQWLAIGNAVGILLVSIQQAKGLSGLGSGLFNLYNISAYVGDLVSFTRLMALGLSGASIGLAFNLIVGLIPGPARWILGSLLFVLLHAINLFLALLSGYVHGARLMFVEFFGKFYEGGGRPFTPLEPAKTYFDIKNHSEEK